jgi:hypothetical protein
MKPTRGHAAVDGARAVPELNELPARNNPMLATGKKRHI